MHARTQGNIIIISHQERILNIADKILLLKAGEVDEYGDGKTVLPKLLDVQAACRYAQN
jgi:Fe-S cluster assembly ATP-binding protein